MRECIKLITRIVSRTLIFPFYLLYQFETFILKNVKSFQWYSQFLSQFPGLLGEYLRREFYRLTLRYCSKESCISYGTIFSTPDVEIYEGAYIGSYCIIGHAKIGKNTLIASRVSLLSGLHQHGFKDVQVPIKDQPRHFETVSIGEDCWIGEGAIIGANIGDHSVIAAGSVVFEDVLPYSIMKGNPAVFVRSRNG